MKLVVFKLKIPIPNKESEFSEFTFNNPNEICEKLDISVSALYAICNKTYKWSHKTSKHLQGIIIERETVYSNRKEKELQMKEEKQKRKQELKKQKEEAKLKEKEEEKIKEQEEFLKKSAEYKSSLIENLSK